MGLLLYRFHAKASRLYARAERRLERRNCQDFGTFYRPMCNLYQTGSSREPAAGRIRCGYPGPRPAPVVLPPVAPYDAWTVSSLPTPHAALGHDSPRAGHAPVAAAHAPAGIWRPWERPPYARPGAAPHRW